MRHTMDELRILQALPLDIKIKKTRLRIKEWVDTYGIDGVYVSFSGGKDSTVLLDIVRKDYPNVQAVFVNTGLEYPSVRKFAESKENVVTLRPKMNFREVVAKYGYPVISKDVSGIVGESRKLLKNGKYKSSNRYARLMGTYKDKSGNKSQFCCENYQYLLKAPFEISDRCCHIMKKSPAHSFQAQSGKAAIIATMAEESRLRTSNWLATGCNAFSSKQPHSNPMSFWTEQDVLTYIHTYNLTIADAYGQVVVKGTEDGQTCINDMLGDYRCCEFVTTGCKRTGCIFCGFGITQDKDRFIRLSEQEPILCDYVMRGGAFDETDGMWKPTNDGMGYLFVLEWLNIHGNLGIGIPNREMYLETYGSQSTEKYL